MQPQRTDLNDGCIYLFINQNYCIHQTTIKGSLSISSPPLHDNHHHQQLPAAPTSSTMIFKKNKEIKRGVMLSQHRDGFRGQSWMLIKVRHGGGPACQGPASIPRQSPQSGDGKSTALKSIMCHLRSIDGEEKLSPSNNVWLTWDFRAGGTIS